MHLNDPQTIPSTLVHGRIVFHETKPRCQKGWGPMLRVPLEVCPDGSRGNCSVMSYVSVLKILSSLYQG